MSRLYWVTGAGKGIGRTLALALAADGHTVAVSARTADDLESLAAEARSAPGRIVAYTLDITDEAATHETVARIETEIGEIDTAVLNAGTHIPMSAYDFDAGALRKLVEVNLLGTANCLAALLKRFVPRRSGTIGVVSSVAGYRGLPTAAGYGATKAALINMCEALKPELDNVDVRLKLICPGFVDTPLTGRNDFPMPFMVSTERAAREIIKGLDSRRFETVFPLRMAIAMKTLRLLPNSLAFAITRRMTAPAKTGAS
jgi:short-subunit dehydrogenase